MAILHMYDTSVAGAGNGDYGESFVFTVCTAEIQIVIVRTVHLLATLRANVF